MGKLIELAVYFGFTTRGLCTNGRIKLWGIDYVS